MIAGHHTEIAYEAALTLRPAGSGEEDDETSKALTIEFHGSLQAISACAFAIDSLYAAVKARSPQLDEEAAWRRNGTKRPSQISETLRRHLRIPGSKAPLVHSHITELFRFRDWAVHPGSSFVQPYYRSDLDVSLDWHYSAFQSENTSKIVTGTVELFGMLIPLAANSEPKDLREWSTGAESHLREVESSLSARCWVSAEAKWLRRED